MNIYQIKGYNYDVDIMIEAKEKDYEFYNLPNFGYEKHNFYFIISE